jgi:hypothetical protein
MRTRHAAAGSDSCLKKKLGGYFPFFLTFFRGSKMSSENAAATVNGAPPRLLRRRRRRRRMRLHTRTELPSPSFTLPNLGNVPLLASSHNTRAQQNLDAAESVRLCNWPRCGPSDSHQWHPPRLPPRPVAALRIHPKCRCDSAKDPVWLCCGFVIESQTSFTIDRLLTLHLLVF